MDTILQCYGTALCYFFNVYQESTTVTIVPSQFFFCCGQDAQFMVDSLKGPYRPSSYTEDLFVPHVTQGAMCRRVVLSTGLLHVYLPAGSHVDQQPWSKTAPFAMCLCSVSCVVILWFVCGVKMAMQRGQQFQRGSRLYSHFIT